MEQFLNPKPKQNANTPIDRRDFLKQNAAIGTGLVIAYFLPLRMGKAFAEERAAHAAAPGLDPSLLQPNAFIHIAPDNTITITINKLEMGQGVNTSMAQLIAEELECDWKKIQCVSAPVAPAYNHTAFGMQMTGGSTALHSSWEQHRRVGAMAREMLIGAAAERWGVGKNECRAEDGFIVHKKLGKVSFGDLANAAASIVPPATIKLKPASKFKIIGKSMPRVDAVAKSTGKAEFGLDIKVPGMLYATIARAPGFGGILESMDDKAARAIPGVLDIIRLPNSVAVLGSNTWNAKKGRDALELKWNMGSRAGISSETIFADYKKLAATPGAVARIEGDAVHALHGSQNKIEADFEFPYLAHACMEPMNCTVDYNGESARIWSGHQMPTVDRNVAAKVLNLPPEKVEVITTYAGGSFGRRASKNSDYVVEACLLAQIVKKPLKVVWMREDDMKGGYYRPLMFHRAEIAFDAKNRISAWKHAIVGQSVVGDSFFESMMVKNGVDPTAVEGVSDAKYAIPNFHVELHLTKDAVPVLWWRSVGHTHTAYVMETLMDEAAHRVKQDPLQYRRELLKASSPRHVAVLDLLAKKSGWGKKKAAKGHAFGLAIHESFGSVVGHVVDISLDGNTPRVHQVWSAVHCGQVVNPQGAAMQVESAIAYGLSAALYQEVAIVEGKPAQNNFHDYQVLRMNEMPKIEVSFVESHDAPTGLGEPGVPPIAPAVANAIFKLTGKRIRRLPFVKSLA